MLRVRQPPGGIAELLSLVNKLALISEPSSEHYFVVNSARSEAVGGMTKYSTFFGTHAKPESSEERFLEYLEKAIQQLPPELQVFVKPEPRLLQNFRDGWCKALGRFLVTCAEEASGGLSFHGPDQPIFGYGHVEAMRQRYLYLFALWEIFDAVAHVEIQEAEFWLDEIQSPSGPSPVTQVKALQGRIQIKQTITNGKKNKTHALTYIKPQTISVLENIEVARIRRCEICATLFWAGRLNQFACGPRCGNRLRAKRWREKHGRITELES